MTALVLLPLGLFIWGAGWLVFAGLSRVADAIEQAAAILEKRHDD
jgi:hypothetical protein